MMNIDDDGYVETLSLEESQSHSGVVIVIEESKYYNDNNIEIKVE